MNTTTYQFRAMIWLLIIASAVVGCSSSAQEGDMEFLGLSGACAPNNDPTGITAAPGEIILENGESLRNVSFDTVGEIEHSVALAMDVYGAGDTRRLDPTIDLMEGDSFDLDGPGVWTIVVIVPEPAGLATVTLDRINYELDGKRYFSDEEFMFEIADSCIS